MLELSKLLERLREFKTELHQDKEINHSLIKFIIKVPDLKNRLLIHVKNFDDKMSKILKIEKENFYYIQELIEILDFNLIKKYESKAFKRGINLVNVGCYAFLAGTMEIKSNNIDIALVVDTLKHTKLKVLDSECIHLRRSKALIEFIDTFSNFVKSYFDDNFSKLIIKDNKTYKDLRKKILNNYDEVNKIYDDNKEDRDFWLLYHSYLASTKLLAKQNWSDFERLAFFSYQKIDKQKNCLNVIEVLIDDLVLNDIGTMVIKHENKLTSKEIEILKFIADSNTSKDIATKLYISENTVLGHRKSIFRKLDAKNNVAAVLKAKEFGII